MATIKKLILFSLFASIAIDAVNIGSDTAVTRFNGQQTVNDGDTIAGFAWLAGGFALFLPTTTGTFNSVFPVSGSINMNHGTLNLLEDLHLNNVTSFASWGNIVGNFHILDMPASLNCFPSSDVPVTNECFAANLSQITEVGNIEGVAVSFDSIFVASASAAANALIINQIVGATTLVHVTSTALINGGSGCSWHPTNDWILVVQNNGGGANTISNFSFTRPAGPLALLSGVNTGQNVHAVDWHPSGNWLAIGQTPGGGAPLVETYPVNGAGTIGALAGSDATSGNVCNSVAFNTAGTFLVAGTASGGGNAELRVYSFNSGTGAIALVASVVLGTAVDSVAWGRTAAASSYIGVAVLNIAGPPINNNGFLVYQFDSVGNTLTQVAAGINGRQGFSTSWNPVTNCVSVGLQHTASFQIGTFSFDPPSNTLTLQATALSNGSVFDMDYSPSGQFLLAGNEANQTSLFSAGIFLIDTTTVTLNNLYLRLNNNATFNQPSLLFTGNSVLDGRNNIMSMAPTFTLYVEPGASLLIKNITLQGLGPGQLVVDSSSTISFQDVTLVLDDNYTFSSGRFEILRNLEIAGVGTSFIYSSTSSSIIRSIAPSAPTTVTTFTQACAPGYNGTLTIDPGVTFQYTSTNATNLIQLEGVDAQWIFNSATLFLSSDLQLTKGRLVFSGKSFLQGTGSLIFGDGISAANDLTVEIRPAANLVVSTKLINRNI